MHRQLFCGLLITALSTAPLYAAEYSPVHESTMWNYFHERLLDKAEFVFDDSILINTPPFAEDARQVPIEIDGRSLPGEVRRIVLWAELNPIPKIMDIKPSTSLDNFIAIRIRVEQATPLRAAFQMADGVWRVGTGHIEADGGGCTAPSVVRAEEGWQSNLGQILGARYNRQEADHLRMRISHPMDNGLVAGGDPEFYLDHAQLRDMQGKVLADIELFPSVSENPTLTLAVKNNPKTELWIRDNNGNEFIQQF